MTPCGAQAMPSSPTALSDAPRGPPDRARPAAPASAISPENAPSGLRKAACRAGSLNPAYRFSGSGLRRRRRTAWPPPAPPSAAGCPVLLSLRHAPRQRPRRFFQGPAGARTRPAPHGAAVHTSAPGNLIPASGPQLRCPRVATISRLTTPRRARASLQRPAVAACSRACIRERGGRPC